MFGSYEGRLMACRISRPRRRVALLSTGVSIRFSVAILAIPVVPGHVFAGNLASGRAQQLDFSGVLVLEPQLTLLPQVEPSGMLHMAGFFPSVPKQLNFEMLWQPVNRQWHLFGLSVHLSDGSPVASETLPQPRPTEDNTTPPQAPTGAVTGQPAKQ